MTLKLWNADPHNPAPRRLFIRQQFSDGIASLHLRIDLLSDPLCLRDVLRQFVQRCFARVQVHEIQAQCFERGHGGGESLLLRASLGVGA